MLRAEAQSRFAWGMWKNIVPRSRRSALLLTKFLVLTVVVWLSLVATSVIVGAGQALGHALLGVGYGPAPTAHALLDFARAYAQAALVGTLSLLILAGYAALSALHTCSILGGLRAGLGLSVLDPMLYAVLLLLGNVLGRPALVNWYRFTPSFNLDNARTWFASGAALTGTLPGITATPSLAYSLALRGLWLGALGGLTLLVFQRQDLQS